MGDLSKTPLWYKCQHHDNGPNGVLAGGICRLPANGLTGAGAASTLAQVSAIRGREAEIAVLGDALDLVESGRRAVVLIEGEAGIGKTRLLDAALDDARRRGMQVAAGRAEELEGMRPFGLMTGVFGCTRSATDPRRAAIGELLSGGTGERNPITVTSDPGLRFRVVDALADLVEELALAGPGRRCAAVACWTTTLARCAPRSTPSPPERGRSSWRSPPRRPGRRWPGAACPARPGSCSTGRPRSTSGSVPPATWPGPRRCCAGRASAVAAGAAAAAAVRLGQPDPDRAHGRQPGGRRPFESPDRRPAVHLAPDGADAPRPRLHQARPHLPRPARRRSHPAGSALGAGVASAPVAGQPRRGQEAREPGAGSRKMRLRARSRTGAGSPLSTASRRESLPHR